MNPKFTHVGIIRGNEAITNKVARRVSLRETTTMWVDHYDQRWRKKDGQRVPRASWPKYRLDLSTVKEAPDADAQD